MTREELEKEAEEYAIKTTDESPYSYNGDQLQRAFLAGYKAGQPQWHDLRKDPNDLPYVSGFYLVSKSCWDGCYTHVHYFNKGGNESGHWDVNVDTLNFMAWCELPKYEVKL